MLLSTARSFRTCISRHLVLVTTEVLVERQLQSSRMRNVYWEEVVLLVSTYVVCERLSVMQRRTESVKANFVLKILTLPLKWNLVPHPPPPEIQFFPWVQIWPISHHTDLTYLTSPHPCNWNSNFFPWVQIWPISHHPHQNSNSNFFLWVQIWPISHHHPPPEIQTLTFSSEFRSDLFHITPSPTPPHPHPPISNYNFFTPHTHIEVGVCGD